MSGRKRPDGQGSAARQERMYHGLRAARLWRDLTNLDQLISSQAKTAGKAAERRLAQLRRARANTYRAWCREVLAQMTASAPATANCRYAWQAFGQSLADQAEAAGVADPVAIEWWIRRQWLTVTGGPTLRGGTTAKSSFDDDSGPISG